MKKLEVGPKINVNLIGELQYEFASVCDFSGKNSSIAHRTLAQSPRTKENGIGYQIDVKQGPWTPVSNFARTS